MTNPGSLGERKRRVAVVLSIVSGLLALGAATALLVGWFWAATRGDWQAFALWAYWFGTPFTSGTALVLARTRLGLKGINFALLGLWGAASLLALLIPFVF